MRGLVYRELHIARKQMLLCSVFASVFVILGILMRFSRLFGNLAKMPIEDGLSLDSTIGTIFSYAPMVLLLSALQALGRNSLADARTKWNYFAYSSPVSEYRYVGARYIIYIAGSVLTLIISIINAALLDSLNGEALTLEKTIDMSLVLMAYCLFILILNAVSTLITDKKKRDIIVSTILISVYLILQFAMFKLLSKLEEEANAAEDSTAEELLQKYVTELIDKLQVTINKLYPLLILAFIILSGLLYLLNVKLLKRREK